MKRRALHLSLLAGLLAVSGFVSAQTKWDLPAAYAATNFHSENLIQFAKDVDVPLLMIRFAIEEEEKRKRHKVIYL